MVKLNSPELKRLSKLLKKNNLQSTLPQLAGLLTVPSLHANTVRIETVVHLAVAHCRGDRNPTIEQIEYWLNDGLNKTVTVRSEEPAENVFITNVATPTGNFRIFEGNRNPNDYNVQTIIDTLYRCQNIKVCGKLLKCAIALLRLSECVANRVGLNRWHSESSTPNGKVALARTKGLSKHFHAVTLSDADLTELGIDRALLRPFIFRPVDKRKLVKQTPGNTSLERCPLVPIGNKLVLALPHAVSPAIRRFVITIIRIRGYLEEFSRALKSLQKDQIDTLDFQGFEMDTKDLKPPDHHGDLPSFDAWLLKYDIDKYLNLVLLHDRLDELDEQGLTCPMTYLPETEMSLRSYLYDSARCCAALEGFSEGTTILVIGGLGRGIRLDIDDWPCQWYSTAILISDFLMMLNEPDRPLTRYLKYLKRIQQLADEGVDIMAAGDDYNLYCFWREHNYQFTPRDVDIRSNPLMVTWTDCVLPVRQGMLKLLDRHVVETIDGDYVPVQRRHCDPYIKSLQERPIYDAAYPAKNADILAGVVEGQRGVSWFVANLPDGHEGSLYLARAIWNVYFDLFDKLVIEAESICRGQPRRPIKMVLDLSRIKAVEEASDQPPCLGPLEELEITTNTDHGASAVLVPQTFIQHLRQPDNACERLVLHSLEKGLIALHQDDNNDADSVDLDSLVTRVMGGPGMKFINLQHLQDPMGHLRERYRQPPIFLPEEDLPFFRLCLSERSMPDYAGPLITSKNKCNSYLHSVVEMMWGQIRQQLRMYDRTCALHELLETHEAIIQDRVTYHMSFDALVALYGRDDVNTAERDRENQRSGAGLAIRTLLEMAVCECPIAGGQQLQSWGLDELVAKVWLLLQSAVNSDGINNDMIKPPIRLYPSGEYSVDGSFNDSIMKPYVASLFDGNFESPAGYPNGSNINSQDDRQHAGGKRYPEEMHDAFKREYGLTITEAEDGMEELIEMGWEQDKLVVETTIGDIKSRLTTRSGFSENRNKAFITSFGLFHRAEWDKPPSGFGSRDIRPWRYNRRLSLYVRPLLGYGMRDQDTVLFGIGLLGVALQHLLDGIEDGLFPQSFFNTKAMQSFAGTVNNDKGHAFALWVSHRLECQAWQTRVEVQMTELGASAELGDVDVLAWNNDGNIQIIECKRLQQARTIAEVAEVLRRFRGEAKDALGKHIKRVEWIINNPECLQNVVGFKPAPDSINHRIITNTQVPMTFLTSLPISPENIGPLE